MPETFKKGQMVPKRLKMAFTHRKVQHCITFGCDVVVNGRVVTPVRKGDGPIIMMRIGAARRRNNGTWQQTIVQFRSIQFNDISTAIHFAGRNYG